MRYIIIFLLLFSGGCSRVLFRQVRYVSTRDVGAKKVLQEFVRLLPEGFKRVDTIVFKYKGKTISGIGYTRVDTQNNTFKAVCLNPVGVKLFEISTCGNEVKTNFVLEKFNESGDAGKVIAEDIKRIYFNCIPSKNAWIRKINNRLIFRHQKGSGVLEHVFAGKKNLLIAKNYYEKKRLIWNVAYFEWRYDRGKIYPAGIVFKHHKYKYELIFRLKEIRL